MVVADMNWICWMLNVEAENYICDDAKSYLSFKTFKYSDPDREMFN